MVMFVELQKINKREAIVVCSFDVANSFGKSHSEVLKSIETLGCTKDFFQNNFALIEYTENGKKSRMYYLTSDGFALLIMGHFDNIRVKEEYLRQFSEMEKMLTAKMIEREKGIVIRQTFAKVVKESIEVAELERIKQETAV